MRVTLLHVADCPNLSLARYRITTAITRTGLDVAVDERLIEDAAAAEQAGFTGSPTVLLDGVDPFASPGTTTSLSCRLYPSDSGHQGAPTVDALVEALRR